MVEDNRTSALKLDTLCLKDIYDQVFSLSNKKCDSKKEPGRPSCIWVKGWGWVKGLSLFMSTPSVLQ